MYKSAFSRKKLTKAIARWKRQRIKIIAVTGARKSGKDVLVGYLKRCYGPFRHVRIAQAPLLIARILDLPPDRRIYHALFGMNALFYPLLGEAVFKRRAARIIDKEKPPRVIVEALRTEEEYQEFVVKRRGILIGVEADPKIRFQRVIFDAKRMKAKRDEAKLSFRKFIGDWKKGTGEFVPGERETSRIVQRAHFVITNNYRTRKPFYREVDQLMHILSIKRKKK